jgi:hypothetical protein
MPTFEECKNLVKKEFPSIKQFEIKYIDEGDTIDIENEDEYQTFINQIINKLTINDSINQQNNPEDNLEVETKDENSEDDDINYYKSRELDEINEELKQNFEDLCKKVTSSSLEKKDEIVQHLTNSIDALL